MNRERKKHRGAAARVLTAFLAAGLALGLPFTAFGAGWQKSGSQGWIYVKDDGSSLSDGFTPDGYYIDGSGVWYGAKTILEVAIPNRSSFLTAEAAGNFETFTAPLSSAQETLSRVLGPIRSFTVYPDRVVLYSVNGSSHKELLSLDKDPATGGYVLELKTALQKEQGNGIYTSWYDYQCLRLLLNLVSPAGDVLSDAIYESWEGKNAYGLALNRWVPVGGAQIEYDAQQGVGLYAIAPVG